MVRGGRLVLASTLTDGMELPTGTTAQRPAATTPWIRFRDDPIDGQSFEWSTGDGNVHLPVTDQLLFGAVRLMVTTGVNSNATTDAYSFSAFDNFAPSLYTTSSQYLRIDQVGTYFLWWHAGLRSKSLAGPFAFRITLQESTDGVTWTDTTHRYRRHDGADERATTIIGCWMADLTSVPRYYRLVWTKYTDGYGTTTTRTTLAEPCVFYVERVV